MFDATFDKQKAEQFSENLVDTLNKSAIALALSIGNRVGLFETMAKLPASTSVQIAEAANLNERYVREWLGVMVTGRIVKYDAGTLTYSHPPNTRRF